MTSRSVPLLLSSFLLAALLPTLPAQKAPANPASPAPQNPAPQSPAKALPPARFYIDKDRAARMQKWQALSTAGIHGGTHYRLSYVAPDDDRKSSFRIDISAKVDKKGDLVFSMPAWRPGSYRIANYGRAVTDLKVENGGKVIQAESLDKNLWRLTGLEKGILHLTYLLPARSHKLRSRNKEARDCYRLRGPSIWMHELRHKDFPIQVELDLPKDWQVATGLDRDGRPRTSRSQKLHRYEASDYDVLIDCPIMMGHFEFFDFRLDGKRFEIAIYGAGKDKTDRQEFASRIKKICGNFGRMFGGFPFRHYTFLFLTGGFGGGGLEHLNSTNISMASLRGSRPGRKSWTDSVISHEFFHLWNVKRLRPEALGPFDYTGPNRTTALWFSEGCTSYYGEKCLSQVGLQAPKDYWKHMSSNYTRLRRNPNRKRMDIAKTSWTVWDGPYMGRPGTVSYYLKGECLGLLLDILIRDATGNEKSLDDVMRSLYAQCMDSGAGFGENDIRDTCSKVAGRSMDEFFDAYVYGTEDLPVASVMPKAGLLVKVTGEGRRTKIELTEDPKAQGVALKIRQGLLAPVKTRR